MQPLPAPTHARWPLGRIDPGTNSRVIVEDDGIRELCQSIVVNGLLQSLLVIDRPADNLIAGFRRHAALKLAGVEFASVMVYPKETTQTQIRIINATENLQRQDLTDPQIYKLCKELMDLNSGWSRQDLATHLGKSPGMITHYLAPEALFPEALEAFMGGKFGFSKAYAISRSPDQEETLRLALGNATRQELGKAVRKKADKPAVTTSKLVCKLVGGAKITITDEDLSLESTVELLLDLVKQMKRASGQGLDVRTFAAVLADMAAAN